jgi:hypothetical protein
VRSASFWLLLGGVVLAASVPASAGSVQARIVIHHAYHGCPHVVRDGGPDAAAHAVTIRRGDSVLVTNDDVMTHELVERQGAPVTYTRVAYGAPMGTKKEYPPAVLARIGASTRIGFPGRGVYRFVTHAGHPPAIETVGPDNLLRLTVTVT